MPAQVVIVGYGGVMWWGQESGQVFTPVGGITWVGSFADPGPGVVFGGPGGMLWGGTSQPID